MRIAFLGDIAFLGKYDVTQNGENAVRDRLKEMKAVLKDFDYVIANLESPLTDRNTTMEAKSMPLKSATVNVNTLVYLGVNAVSLANNHIYDYGKRGLAETTCVLDTNKIAYFGIDETPLDVDLHNEKISVQGFCCFTANGWHYDALHHGGRLNTLTIEHVDAFVRKAKENGRYPIIVPHWGEENTHYPRSEHVYFAKEVIQNGDCSIVGHHPHVPQGVMLKENGLCAFSLGNFIFDDCYCKRNGMRVVQTDDNKRGFLLGMTIEAGKMVDHTIIAYSDETDGIQIDDGVRTLIEQYSETIASEYGKPGYEQLRTKEQQEARQMRLGVRDFKWLLNHMTYSSIMSVVQRKVNMFSFRTVVGNTYESACKLDLAGKAIYVGNFGLPYTNAAGKRVYTNSLLISRCGYDVMMIGTDPAAQGRVEKVSERVEYTSFPKYGKSSGRKYFEWLYRQIKKSPEKPAVVFRYGSPGLAVFDRILYKYCKAENIPLVVDVVDWLSVDSGKIIFRVVKGLDTHLEKRFYNKMGDALIAISKYLDGYYADYFPKRMILPPLVEAYSARENNNSVPQIIYAGNPFRKGERVKNVHTIKDRLDLIIQAFCALEKKGESFRLNIVGLNMEEFLVAFPEFSEILCSSKQIVFYGHQPMEKTQEMIKNMDFSILLREKTRATMAGFPTKVVESMSLGTPVITTDTSDLADYIKHGENGYLVDIENDSVLERELADILHQYLTRQKEMKQQIMSEKSFMIDCFEDQFKQFIKDII